MRRTEAHQGVRMAKFLNVLGRWESAELNQEEAAELLGVSERTFRRWTRRYEEEGEAGLLDRRLGKASGKRVPVDRAEEVERLYRERYQGFTVKHFHEHLVKDHGFGWGYTWTKLHLQWKGVREGAAQGGASAQARAAAAAGDDAASGRLAPRLARGPGGARPDRDHGRCDGGDLLGVPDRGGGHGLDVPGAEGGVRQARPADEPLHRPRGHYFHTPKAGGKIDRGHPTQVGRALEQLGVEHIGAYSPQARADDRSGRSGRFRTGSSTSWRCRHNRDRGGQRLPSRGLPARPQRPFRGSPAGEGSAFTPIPGVDLDEILCVQEERQVGNDNCVSYRTLKLQIPESPMRPHFVKARVKVHVYPDGSHAVFHGPRCIGRYDENGTIRDARKTPLKSARRRACGRHGQASGLPTPPTGRTKAEEADI